MCWGPLPPPPPPPPQLHCGSLHRTVELKGRSHKNWIFLRWANTLLQKLSFVILYSVNTFTTHVNPITNFISSDKDTNYVKLQRRFLVKYRTTSKYFVLHLLFLKEEALICFSFHYTRHRPLWSSSSNLLSIPKTKKASYGDRSFSVIAPRLWNDLPSIIKLCSNVDCLKSRLKSFLFKRAFSD